MSAAHIDPDRVAELVNRHLAELPEEQAHLAFCEDCRRELRLVRAAAGLGSEVAGSLDPERLMTGVRERLEAEPAEMPVGRSSLRGRWLIGLAAAAVLVLAVRLAGPGAGVDSPNAEVPQIGLSTLHELDDLSAPELEAVLQTIPPSAEAMSHGGIAPLGDLTTKDLEQVFRSMEE